MTDHTNELSIRNYKIYIFQGVAFISSTLTVSIGHVLKLYRHNAPTNSSFVSIPSGMSTPAL